MNLLKKLQSFLNNNLSATQNYNIVPIQTTNSDKIAKRPFFSALNSKKLSNLLNCSLENWEVDIDNFLNKFYQDIK